MLRRQPRASIRAGMSTTIIVSYDGTPNDDDALALGKMLARTGASLALAYVRHAREFDPRREELAEHDAQRRLEQGASWLVAPDTPRHVVLSGSTGEGLEALAEREEAQLIVFGSDYRTPPGHAEPGNTAQHLLEGSPVAIAVAAAGLRTTGDASIQTVGVSATDADAAALQTAQALAEKTGASVNDQDEGSADLIVVGSPGPEGRIGLSGIARSRLNAARGSVLVVPNGRPVRL
jgi:nucleotide-binding universal stress UspA family protein